MSKTNIKMKKPTYIVKPEDGVVVCSIQACGNMDNYHNLLICYSLIQKIRKRFHINYVNEWQTFTVVARLHKDDKWDEVTGKRIAESKCKRKIYEFYCRLYSFVIDEILHNDIALFNQYADNLMYCYNRETRHLKELTGNEDKH